MIRGVAGGFLLHSFRGARDLTILCNPGNPRFVALQVRAAITTAHKGNATAGMRAEWDIHRVKQGGFWAVSRIAPILVTGGNRWDFERAVWDKRTIREALSSIVIGKAKKKRKKKPGADVPAPGTRNGEMHR